MNFGGCRTLLLFLLLHLVMRPTRCIYDGDFLDEEEVFPHHVQIVTRHQSHGGGILGGGTLVSMWLVCLVVDREFATDVGMLGC